MKLDIDLTPLEQFIARAAAPPRWDIIQQGLGEAAEFVRQTWIGAVTGGHIAGMKRTINSQEYAQGLQTGDSLRLISPLEAVVACTWHGAEDIQRGSPPYDLKPGLIYSTRVRFTKKDHQPFHRVAFRQGTPGGSGGGSGTGRANIHMVMPTQVHRVAKQGGTWHDFGSVGLGQQSKPAAALQGRADAHGHTPPGMPVAGGYTWKSGAYQNLQRYNNANQSVYLTFRTISRKSDPKSWWHPGFEAVPLPELVVKATRDQVNQHMVEVVKAAYGF